MDPLSTLNEEEVKRRSPQVNLADPVEGSDAPEIVKTDPSIASILAKNKGEAAPAAASVPPPPPMPTQPTPPPAPVVPPPITSEAPPVTPPPIAAAPVVPAFRRRRRSLMVLAGLIILGVLGFGGYRLYQNGNLPFKPPVKEVQEEPTTPTPSATTQSVAPTVTAVDGKTVTSGAQVYVTTNRPVLSGKGTPSASLSVTVAPENTSFTTTVDESGNWSLTPNLDISNGDHTVSVSSAGSTAGQFSFKLGVNNDPAATAQSTPAPAAAPAATPEPAATPAPVATTPADTSTELAATGDNTRLINLMALLTIGLALVGVVASRRHVRR